MELMHPGEAHELMHKMMGGEGSEAVRQMHIQMARSIYCNEPSTMMHGMMENWNYWYIWYAWWFLTLVFIIGLILIVYLAIIKLWRDLFVKKKGGE